MVWSDRDSIPQSSALGVSTLTITLSMRLHWILVKILMTQPATRPGVVNSDALSTRGHLVTIQRAWPVYIVGIMLISKKSKCIVAAKIATPNVKEELPTFPEHLTSPPAFCELRIVRSLGFCVLFCIFVCLFLSAIALSVLFRFTDSDYPVGIFQLSLFATNQLSLRLQLQPIIVVLVSHLYPFLMSMQVL